MHLGADPHVEGGDGESVPQLDARQRSSALADPLNDRNGESEESVVGSGDLSHQASTASLGLSMSYRTSTANFVQAGSSTGSCRPDGNHAQKEIQLVNMTSMPGMGGQESGRPVTHERAGVSFDEALQLLHAHSLGSLPAPKEYSFRRPPESAVAYQLGATPRRHGGGSDTLGHLDIYTKSATFNCFLLLLTVCLDVPVLQQVRAMERLGFFIPTLALLFLSGVMLSLAHRLIDVPPLVSQDMETYGEALKATFKPMWYWLYAVANVVCLFLRLLVLGAIIEYYLFFIDAAVVGNSMFWFLYVPWKTAQIGILWRAATKPDMKSYVFSANMATICLVALLLVIVVMSIMEVASSGWAQHHKNVSDTNSLRNTIYYTVKAFCGVSFVPYVVAEMQHPQQAKQVVTAVTVVVATYTLVSSWVVYLSWANVEYDVVLHFRECWLRKETGWRSRMFGGAYVMCSLLVTLTGYVKFGILIWPFVREVQQLLSLDKAPAHELHVPWAVRSYVRAGKALRILAVSATVLSGCVVTFYKALHGKDYFGKISAIMFALLAISQMIAIPALHWTAIRRWMKADEAQRLEEERRNEQFSEDVGLGEEDGEEAAEPPRFIPSTSPPHRRSRAVPRPWAVEHESYIIATSLLVCIVGVVCLQVFLGRLFG